MTQQLPHKTSVKPTRLLKKTRLTLKGSALIGLLCVGVALFGTLVFAFAYRAEMDQAAARGETSLALAADRLTTALQRYRELGVILADHPAVLSVVVAHPEDAFDDIQTIDARYTNAADLLQKMSDRTGAQSLMLVGAGGRVLASTADTFEAYLPPNAKAAFDRAMNGALGVTHFVDPAGRRRFIYAAPVFEPGRGAKGAVIVNVDVALIEWSWPADPTAVFFTDNDGVVFVSNRSELILKGGGYEALPIRSSKTIDSHDIWSLSAGRYLPARALHLSRPLPIVDLTGELLLDLAPVRRLAFLQAGAAATLGFALAGFLILAAIRRRALAQINTELEVRVASRTEALEVANRDLTHEVHEREEAEAQLKRAQADLVQAGKLTALGEMSAGISHELNQPLMAIRSFSENAQTFLERGKQDRAADNLIRISELSRRMGRIIKNLRAFARQENEAVTSVDLAAVVDAALEMTTGKLNEVGARIEWEALHGIFVRGGDVRLQQVVVNLLSNAADSVKGKAIKDIKIILLSGDPVVLTVADTGAGIVEPEKIYDPFYTTKEIGAAAGMGLGLSISYGLIQSFGGQIKAKNRTDRKDGGAIFTIELPRAEPHDAAK
jgi:two-component system C4-dicarboxylate transport sensor histidine kinase DctB